MKACEKFSRTDIKLQTPDPTYHQNALLAEQEILKTLAGFKIGIDAFIFDVPIDFYGKNYIHTISCGNQNSIDLVLLHGYGGSGVTFYKMLKNLSQHYRVFAIDMLGLGLSSKPVFDLTDTEECIAFFVESIEKWREKLKLKKFHLAGHSMGGYISGFYTVKYPDHVLKLSLLSAAGIDKHCEEYKFEKYLDGLSLWQKLYMEYMWNYWKKKKTPQSVIKQLGTFGKTIFSKYFASRFQRLPKEELEILTNYMINALMEPESSEKALHFIFLPPKGAAILPLEDHLISMKISVDLYFGTRDWIDWKGPQRLSELTNGRINCLFIPFSGHQLIIENANHVTDHMVLFAEEQIGKTNEGKKNSPMQII